MKFHYIYVAILSEWSHRHLDNILLIWFNSIMNTQVAAVLNSLKKSFHVHTIHDSYVLVYSSNNDG